MSPTPNIPPLENAEEIKPKALSDNPNDVSSRALLPPLASRPLVFGVPNPALLQPTSRQRSPSVVEPPAPVAVVHEEPLVESSRPSSPSEGLQRRTVSVSRSLAAMLEDPTRASKLAAHDPVRKKTRPIPRKKVKRNSLYVTRLAELLP